MKEYSSIESKKTYMKCILGDVRIRQVKVYSNQIDSWMMMMIIMLLINSQSSFIVHSIRKTFDIIVTFIEQILESFLEKYSFVRFLLFFL